LALVFVRTHASAEDVVQDVWAGVIRGLDSFEERSSLKTWIFRILTNRAKTRATQEARTLPATFALSDDPEPAVDPKRFKPDGAWTEPLRPWGDDTPEKLLLRQEAIALVQKSIDELPARQRAVIQLRDVEGESAETVCNVLEINETNQRVLLHRARTRVRRTLEQYLSEAAHDLV
jgi:RNA polymerase sigma-70 factor (ECF subfamily)